MKTEISRISFDALKRYSGIYQQMGRMFTDSDWNELTELDKQRLADVLRDVIGSGTPRTRGIIKITSQADGSESFALRWGYAYVDGLNAQLRPDPDAVLSDPLGEAFEYGRQADFPQPPAQPAGDHTLYLDVWERTVLSLEDESLRDPGLHGADTCTRTQTMAQVKWCPFGTDPEDTAQNPPIGNAELTLVLSEGSTEPDPCDPCAEEVLLQDKVGNYLFRVEIHHVEYDGAGQAQQVVLKWSRENGAQQYAIDDAPIGFESEHWAYEFFSGASAHYASEKQLGRHLATGFSPTVGELSTGYPDTLPSGFSLVRRWDGYCRLLKDGSDWKLDQGSDLGVELSSSTDSHAHGHVDEGPTVSIRLDAIALSLKLADQALLAGDFWLREVRQAVDLKGDTLLDAQPPQGIVHHYMTLGSMQGGEFIAHDGAQCKRLAFPPLTDIQAGDVCYNNAQCEMPQVHTVQEAIDYLCRERDLRWHNKHLHGWGIVCGLIAACGPDTVPERENPHMEAKRREVSLSKGYALSCEGEDMVLETDLVLDLIARIEKLEAQGTSVLKDGAGTVCLRLDIGPHGEPEVHVEPYDKNKHDGSALDDTLLMDFFQDCILDLVLAIGGEFQFLNAEELEEVEGGATGLVSDQRRKLISFLNLIIQLLNSGNGRYVFLSHKEHLILRDLYLQLRQLLQSKTFCGMFQDEQFPEYPFKELNMSTFFGKNSHTRVKVHPDGQHIYTYGGTDNTINRYSVKSRELVQVIEMPSAEGAEVSAIAFSTDGKQLYATASVRGVDSVFGIARIDHEHHWEQMAILCNLEIIEMQVAADDPGLIYATGRGQGLFFLRPEVFMDESKPRPVPAYAFNAVGHLAIDEKEGLAYCTSLSDSGGDPVYYDEVAICRLQQDAGAEDGQAPTRRLPLTTKDGGYHQGTDGLALRPAGAGAAQQGPRLYVVVNRTQGSGKILLTYARPIDSASPQPIATLDLEQTDIALAYHRELDHLLLAMEDGYRLQAVSPDGKSTPVPRIPVQIQPTDLAVDDKQGTVYTLNFISNTLSVIPAKELFVSDDMLEALVQYRGEVLKAFFGLLSNILQYLKDCFCHHLLVQCPDCHKDEAIYLAVVEIKENKVYKVCNFEKRKYVKTFPTLDYWLSLLPVMPLLKTLVSKLCCAIVPDIFGPRLGGNYHVADMPTMTTTNALKATTARKSVQTYNRTDFRSLLRNQGKSLQVVGRLMGDNMLSFAETQRRKDIGVRKQALLQSSVNEAVKTLEKNQVEVVSVSAYDEKRAGTYLKAYTGTPQLLEPGSKVRLYQKDGKVVFYSIDEQVATAAPPLSDALNNELSELEKRKEELANLSALKAELAEVEARRENLVELDAAKTELADLQARKGDMEAELAALKSQVDAVQLEREAEAAKLKELSVLREEIATDVVQLDKAIQELGETRLAITSEIAKERPVKELAEITPEMDGQLREMGIRTMGELSLADPNTLAESGGLEPETAKRLILLAKERLVVR